MARAGQEQGNRHWFTRWSGWIALLIFAVSAALLLHKSLLPQYTLVPLEIIQDIKPWDSLDLGPRANRLLIDPFFIFYPNRALQTAAIQSGRLPFWNPALFTGTPLIADPNFQSFYPPNLIAALVLPVEHALPWLAWAHLTLTGLFMYLFLCRKQLRWLAATLGGGVWMLNGYLLVWLENPHRLSTAAWLPAIFWAFEVAMQEKKPRWAALAGIFLALAILGGQVQFVFIFGLALFLYTLFHAFWRWRDGRHDLWQPLAYLLLAAVIGFSIGALVILPAAEFSSFSQRTVANGSSILDSRWPMQQLITLIAPDFFGNPATEVHYWGAINFAEVTAYFGIVALLLALAAVLVTRDKRFLLTTLCLLAVILLLALGTPLSRALSFLPGFQFLALRRMIILIPFLGTWLAAAGLDGWLRASLSWKRALASLGLALLIMAGILIWSAASLGQPLADNRAAALQAVARAAVFTGAAILLLLATRRQPAIAGLLLLALTIGELLYWGRPFNPITSTEYLYPDNAVTDFLQQDPDLFRVLPLQAGKTIFGPNILPLFGLEDISGYSSLIKGKYAALLRAMDPEVAIGWMRGNENILVMSHFHPLVSILNVKYVLSAEELSAQPELQLVERLDGVWVYENLKAAERAYLVNHVQQVATDRILPTLLSSDFDWRTSALISEPLPAEQAAQLAKGDPERVGQATVIKYAPESVTIGVQTAEPAFLVLADAYYPGWQALLNGQFVPIYETNQVLRGVYVPAGSHEVIFNFQPRPVQIGLLLALTGLLIAVVVVVWDYRR
ncbi:MAG: YfhO family protein [Candidatus Promineifilaceae bacterium]|nr:YfhO family protein [Candidatus Promineifilaceae bacterium]